MQFFRSPSGENDFKPMPHEIPRMKVKDAMPKYYKNFVYGNVGHCSNLPKFEDIKNGKWPQMKYVIERCVVTGKGFPEILPDGTYKIVYLYIAEVEWSVTFVVSIKSKLIP